MFSSTLSSRDGQDKNADQHMTNFWPILMMLSILVTKCCVLGVKRQTPVKGTVVHHCFSMTPSLDLQSQELSHLDLQSVGAEFLVSSPGFKVFFPGSRKFWKENCKVYEKTIFTFTT